MALSRRARHGQGGDVRTSADARLRDQIRAEWETGPLVRVREATADDATEAGRICYDAFASLADRHGFAHDFPSVEAATTPIRWMIRHHGFYGVVAEAGGRVVGSSFMDERGPIFGIGPVSVDPEAQDRRTGHLLMEAMFARAAAKRAPGVRLLQLAYHNRSLSLYAKLGMDVRGTYAAMYGDPIRLALPGYAVRAATEADLGACDALCLRVHGHARTVELAEATADGKALVVERLGRITAYSTGVNYFSHSVAETSDDLRALIGATSDYGSPGFLVPLADAELFRWCLLHGLRVFFVLNMMTMGLYQEPRGAFMPSVGY
jgi:GNAT superfamily N-acetyltransferase